MISWWRQRSPQAKFLIIVVALIVVYTVATSGSRAATPVGSSPSPSPVAVATTPTPSSPPPASPSTATPTARSTLTCQLRGSLPDPVCTPGATDPRVTQANIGTTICVSGYTTTVRPPTSYTTPLEVQLIARYGLALTPQQTELDHLIALELGGNPTDVRNLFPEPYLPTPGAHEKDTLENKLHSLVCAGQIDLATAQTAIATDWVAAYARYVGR